MAAEYFGGHSLLVGMKAEFSYNHRCSASFWSIGTGRESRGETDIQTAIVYESIHHGNTRRIAEAMAQPLDAALYSVEQALALDCRSLDLIGLGSGIYLGRHHASLLDLVRKMKFIPPRCFVFSTAGIASLSGWWHRALIQQIRGRGSNVIGQFCCPGWDTVGPLVLFGGLHRRRPNAKDLLHAAEFALRL